MATVPGIMYFIIHTHVGMYTVSSEAMQIPEALKLYTSYLKEMYERMPLDENWPPVQAQQYVPLVLVQTDPKQPQSEGDLNAKVQQILSGKIEKTAKAADQIDLSELFQPDKGGRKVKSILVEGAPGIGKTALSFTVCKQWVQGKCFLDFQAVVFWSLKDPLIVKFTSVDDLIYHDSDEVKKVVVQAVRKYSGRGVLFVLDGWDELPHSLARNRQSFLFNLVKGKVLPQACVIVTSRPIRAQNLLLQAGHFQRCVEIYGFSKENVREYIERCFASTPSEAQLLLKQLDKRPDIASSCYLPMNCAIVSYVFSRKQELPSTMTAFYSFLAKNSLLRNIQLRGKDEDEVLLLNTFADLPPDVEKVFLALCRLAFQGLWVNRYTYTRDEIAAVCQSTPRVIVNVDALGILQAVNVFHSSGLQSSFHFLHSSIQQFMAATYLASLEPEKQNYYIQTYLHYMNFRAVWQFYCGISGTSSGGFLSMTKSGIVEKFCQEVLDITESDGEYHDHLSCTSSDDESSSANSSEVEIEEEEVTETETRPLEELLSGDNLVDPTNPDSGDSPKATAFAISSSDPEEVTMIDSKLQSTDVTTAEPKLPSTNTTHIDSDLPSTSIVLGPCPSKPPLSMPKHSVADEEDRPLSRDEIGSHKHSSLGRLEGVNVVMSGVTSELAMKVTPSAMYRESRYDLLFVLRCAYESQLPELCSAIAKNCYNQHLFFENSSRLNPTDMNALGYLIARARTTSKYWQVGFSNCPMSVQHLASFRHHFQQKLPGGKLKRLYISNSDLDADGALELVNMSSALALCEKLMLSNNKLGDQGAKILSSLVPHLHFLRALDLSSNSIGDEGVKQLTSSLKQCQALTHLELSSNDITEIGARDIAELAQEIHTLVHIDVNSNEIGDSGTADFAALLGSNAALQYLDLGNNSITEIGAAHLASALTVNTCLQTLIFHSNPLGSGGAEVLFTMIPVSNSLTRLDLQDCSIKCNKSLQTVICNALQFTTSLQTLELSANDFNDSEISAVLEAVNSSNVTGFKIADSGIGEEGLQSLGALLCQNVKIKQLALASHELISNPITFEGLCDCLTFSEGMRRLEILNFDGDSFKEQIEQRVDNINSLRKANQRRKIKLNVIDMSD